MGKKLLYTITIAGLVLPFVFITDFYPFFRLGMFAEPVKKNTQKEYFLLYQSCENGFCLTRTDDLNINANNFLYLARNYYYRKEGEIFLQKISALKPSVEEWRLYRKTDSAHDSTLLVSWKKH